MKSYLQNIYSLILQNEQLSDEAKQVLLKSLAEADKQWTITDFKLDRTEKVKHTTAVLLEETIEELEQKRKAVEGQNRELEIESSLERVRTVAMSMNKADDMLDVCRTISHELELLAVKEIRNVQTAIFYEAKGTYMNYEYYTRHDKTFITETTYTNNEIHQAFAQKMLKGNGEFFITHIKGDEVKDWVAYQKTTNVFIDEYLYTASSLNYYWFSLGPVALGISTYSPLSEANIDLFKRFRNVFELSYRRYLDIEKAEAQAREAQIEAALEKVRSSSMAMHRSDELHDVIMVVTQQLEQLGFKFDTANFITNYTDKGFDWCISTHRVRIPANLYCPSANIRFFEKIRDVKRKGIDFYTDILSFEEKNELFEYLFESTLLKHTPEERKQYVLKTKGLASSSAVAEHMALSIVNYQQVPYTEAENLIIKRIGKVFEQTYTRFLDLQKAEAQAREAQVQLSLERVRARTMAMHNSAELAEAVYILFQQFKELGENPDQATVGIINEDERVIEYWVTMYGNQMNRVFKFSMDEPHVTHKIYQAWKAGEKSLVIDLSGKELREFMEYRASMGGAAVNEKETRRIINVAFFSKGLLNVQSNETRSIQNITLLERFAAVFEQTYTRFLDLQKAEAQAREAQIEAALERVRSRSIGMHKSDELIEVVRLLDKEITGLGIETNGSHIITDFANRQDGLNDWYARKDAEVLEKFHIPYIADPAYMEHPIVQKLINALNRGADFYMEYYSKAEINNYYRLLFEYSDFRKISQERREFIYNSPGLVRAVVLSKNSVLIFQRFNFKEFTKAEGEIFKRFGKVFEQTYTRFLDLQKAEAQTRESQIQLALERVRARTMAMQKSDELAETASVLFKQIMDLGNKTDRFSIYIVNEEEGIGDGWVTDQLGTSLKRQFKADLNEKTTFRKIYDAWKKGYKSLSIVLEGDELKEWLTYVRHSMGLPVNDAHFNNKRHHNIAFFSRGWFFFSSFEPLDKEAILISERFAKVFEQSYTRFMDLKNAEAQARESQIEAAMEKVRAGAMAMQKPNELIDVAQLLRKEMGLLGVEELETSSIYIHNEASGLTECWFAIKDIREGERKLVADHMTMQLNDTWVGREMLKFYTSDQKQTSILMQGRNRKEWINYCSQHSKLLSGYYGNEIPDRTYHLLKFSNGYMGAASPGDISAESWDLLRRATAVFSLAYTRFSDLQLAEARAREAMIEAALERVRAQAMAMHKTEDLSSAVATVFEEMDKLDLGITRCGIGILDKERKSAEVWTAHQSQTGNTIEVSGNESMDIHPLLQRAFDAWLKQQEDFSYVLEGEDMIRYYQAVRGPNFRLPESELILSLDKVQKQYYYAAIFKAGGLFALQETELSEEAKKLIKRFANVFDLTYTRFLDLQKAEANAREAMKRAALDRIRADIASMRTVNDLNKITPLIWNELTILGLSFIRCGVFIMDQEQQLIHTFLSTPDGKAIAAFHLPFSTPGNFRVMLDHWRNKENLH
jgi:hypothetical protein